MKKVALVFTLVISSVFAGAAYAYHQATSLPSWYQDTQATPIDPAKLQQNAAQVETKLRSLQTPNQEIRLSQQEINDVVTASVDQAIAQAQLPRAVKGMHTELQENKLKTGAVVDLQELQSSNLSESEQTILGEVLKRIPGINDRTIYIGIESSPRIVKGQMELDPNTKIQIGNLSFSLQEVAQKVGMTPAEVQQEINRLLPTLQQIPLEQASVENGNLVLRSREASSDFGNPSF
ncbi:MAG: hypothetical protein VKJ24_14865 [Synechococcales bacterium]|nr:hypothetical protein [Synechococcales bacterium]